MTAEAWWRGFFDRDYLASYGPRFSDDESAGEARAAVALAGCEPGARVLDAPCGFGRHALPLARAGFEVVGVDQSGDLLAEARRRAGSGQAPMYVEGDVGALPFPDASFDCALTLFTSIGYDGDEADVGTFAEARRVLRPGGRLVVETVHRDRLAAIYRERDWERLPDGALLLEERRFDLVAGTFAGTQAVVAGEGPPAERSYVHRVYTATELVALLRRAGFADVRCFGDLHGGELRIETRLVALAAA